MWRLGSGRGRAVGFSSSSYDSTQAVAGQPRMDGDGVVVVGRKRGGKRVRQGRRGGGGVSKEVPARQRGQEPEDEVGGGGELAALVHGRVQSAVDELRRSDFWHVFAEDILPRVQELAEDRRVVVLAAGLGRMVGSRVAQLQLALLLQLADALGADREAGDVKVFDPAFDEGSDVAALASLPDELGGPLEVAAACLTSAELEDALANNASGDGNVLLICYLPHTDAELTAQVLTALETAGENAAVIVANSITDHVELVEAVATYKRKGSETLVRALREACVVADELPLPEAEAHALCVGAFNGLALHVVACANAM